MHDRLINDYGTLGLKHRVDLFTISDTHSLLNLRQTLKISCLVLSTSKSSTLELLVKRPLTWTEWVCTWLLPPLLNSSLICSWLHSKPWKSEFKPCQVTLTTCEKLTPKWAKNPEIHSTKVLNHFGSDKFHTPWWNSHASKKPSKCSTNTLFQNHELNAPKANNSLSLLLLVTLLVSSVPSSLTQPIALSPFWTNLQTCPLARLFPIWEWKVSGLVLDQGSWWSVLWPLFNGLSTIQLKSLSDSHDHRHQPCQKVWKRDSKPKENSKFIKTPQTNKKLNLFGPKIFFKFPLSSIKMQKLFIIVDSLSHFRGNFVYLFFFS